jgi:hypothetical protein
MRDVPTGDWPNGRGLNGGDRRGLAIERHELDLEGLAVGVNVNDGSNVAANQVLAGYGRSSTRLDRALESSTQRLQ